MTKCTATARASRPTPTAIVTGLRYSNNAAETAHSTRSGQPARRISHPPVTTASAATATAPTAPVQTMSPIDPSPSMPSPLLVSTNANGTRNAGSVYFHVCIMVGITRPPVIADAATEASAVGGVTSDSTAK